METHDDDIPTAGQRLLDRAQAAASALDRELQREIDPAIAPLNLLHIVGGVAAVAQENVHLGYIADAASQFLNSEFEDDRYFAREKMKAAVEAWEEWKSQQDAR